MEKINDMMPKLADDELESVGGGKRFDVFTTEFKEFFGIVEKEDNLTTLEIKDEQYSVNTLEMRIDPSKNKKRNDKNNIVKL